MILWIGADVDAQLAALRDATRKAQAALGFDASLFTLPFHVSLKMSFFVPDERAEEAMDALAAFFAALSPITAAVRGVERENGIVWLRLAECPALDEAHDRLNALMREGFGVPLHPYDSDYLFHTTLFMDADNEKLARACEMVRGVPVPGALTLRRFLIGGTPTGELGTYRVFRAVER